MRTGGQSSPSPSHLPTDSVRVSVLIIAELARGQVEHKSLKKNSTLAGV